MKILADVDGTLIDFKDKPRREIIDLLLSLHRSGHEIYISSGGGVDYAQTQMNRIALSYYEIDTEICDIIQSWDVLPKGPNLYEMRFDLSIDDENVSWGRVNLRVNGGYTGNEQFYKR